MGSIGKAFQQKGWDVVSVDISPSWQATHTCNILEWDYTIYPNSHFQFIWASPCCTHYSKARTTGGPRDMEGADALVSKVLEIIDYFGETAAWALENPSTGLLPTRDIVRGLPSTNTTYCKYGYPYRKLTTIWNNLELQLESPCCSAYPCEQKVGRRHPETAQRGSRHGEATGANSCSQAQLSSIPPSLCDEIADAATKRVLVRNDQAGSNERVDAPAT